MQQYNWWAAAVGGGGGLRDPIVHVPRHGPLAPRPVLEQEMGWGRGGGGEGGLRVQKMAELLSPKVSPKVSPSP